MTVCAGYKVTYNTVQTWRVEHNITICGHSRIISILDYLDEHRINLKVLVCDYEGEPIFLFVTNEITVHGATPKNYPQFDEGEYTRTMKNQVLAMGFESCEFVTVPDPLALYCNVQPATM